MKNLLYLTLLLSTHIFAQQPIDGINVFPQSATPTVAISVRVNGATTLNKGGSFRHEITLPTNSITLEGLATTTVGNFGQTGYGMWVQLHRKESNSLQYFKETDTVNTGSAAADYEQTITYTGLVHGIYYFRYYKKKYDTQDSVFYQDVKVVVSNSASPSVNAGNDTTVSKWQEQTYTFKGETIQAGEQYFILDGTESKGASSYLWTQVEGPVVEIDNPNAARTEVHGITEGIYRFKLTINGNNALSQTNTYRFQDENKKWGAPCRSGAPMTFAIPPSTGPTLDASTGRTYAAWRYKNIKKYVFDTYGEQLSGNDILTFNGAGIDSVITFEIKGFGGSAGCPVYLRTATAAPIRLKKTGTNTTFLHFSRSLTFLEDTIGSVYFILDGTYWRPSGTRYSWIIDNAAWAAQAAQTQVVAPRTSANFWNGGTPMVGSYVSDFTIRGVQGIGVGYMQFKWAATPAGAGHFNKFILKNISIADCWWEKGYTEGAYFGDTDPGGSKSYNHFHTPPSLKNLTIENNYFNMFGWDGIQATDVVSGLVIKNNLVTNVAIRGWAEQRTGIMFGGNSNGSMEGNVIQNVKGDGFNGLGHSTNQYKNNVVDSTQISSTDGVSAYARTLPMYPQSYPNHTSVFDGNIFSRWGRVPSIRITATGGNMGTPSLTNNTFITTKNPTDVIESAFNYTASGNRSLGAFTWRILSVSVPTGTSTSSFLISAQINDSVFSFNDVASLNLKLRQKAGGNLSPKVESITGTKNVTLPSTTATLTATGSDADGTVASKLWTKVSGGTANITSPTSYSTTVQDLELGSYIFRITLTDNDGASTFSDFAVNVNAFDVNENTAPTVDVPTPATVTTQQAILTASVFDPENSVLSYQWEQVSGPSTAVISSSEQTAVVSSLISGVYVFRVTVSDEVGATGTDEVAVTVNLAAQPYARVYGKILEVKKFGGPALLNQVKKRPMAVKGKAISNNVKTPIKKTATKKKAAATKNMKTKH